jgi:iron(III) transport system permease protein
MAGLSRGAALVGGLLILFLIVAPIGFLVWGSFRTGSIGQKGTTFTLDNWGYALGPEGLRLLGSSALLGAVTAAISLVLGVAIAWLVVRTNMPGRRVLGGMMIVPLLFSPLMTTLAWIGLADPHAGLLNALFANWFGGQPAFNIYSFPGVVMILVLHLTPYVYVAVRPALRAVSSDLEDASRILGVGTAGTVRRVTFPLIMPAILSSGFLVFVLAAEDFSVPSILGRNANFLTIPYAIYGAFARFPPQAGRGSALGLLLTLLVVIGMIVYLWVLRRQSKYVAVTGKGARAQITALPAWGRWLGALMVSLYLFLAVLLPYLMLIIGSFSRFFSITHLGLDLLTLDNYMQLFQSNQFWSALQSTLILVAGAGVIAIAIGVFAAWTSVRGKGRARRLIDYAVTLPVLVPGVAMGLGMLWAYIYIPTGLYGTLGILMVAYITRYMGHGSRIATSSLLQLSPEFEEAAYTLGRSRLQAFATITLRMLAPSLVAGGILIVIFSSLEVPASVMLYTGNSMPLSVLIYLTMQGGVVVRAFAPAAVLATAIFIGVILAQWRFKVFEYL